MKFLALGAVALMVAAPSLALTRIDSGPQSDRWYALHHDVVSGKEIGTEALPPVVINEPSTPAAVPEPASWALMVGGFGLVGGALRRRSMAGVAA